MQCADCSRVKKRQQKKFYCLYLFSFIILSQTDVTYVAATTRSVSSKQRQREKKINVLQTWRRAHPYLSGMYYILFCYCCCCLTKWEIFQFKKLSWIDVSTPTVKPVKSKRKIMHSQHGYNLGCTWTFPKRSTWTLVDHQGHVWMMIFLHHAYQSAPLQTCGCRVYDLALSHLNHTDPEWVSSNYQQLGLNK